MGVLPSGVDKRHEEKNEVEIESFSLGNPFRKMFIQSRNSDSNKSLEKSKNSEFQEKNDMKFRLDEVSKITNTTTKDI